MIRGLARRFGAALALGVVAVCGACSNADGTAADSSIGSDTIWNQSSRTVDPTALPLGNGKYVTDEPRRGYVFTCDARAFTFRTIIGARVTGPWVHESTATFDRTAKLSIQGNVLHDGSFTISVAGDERSFQGNGLPLGVPTGVFPVQTTDPAYEYDQAPIEIEEQPVAFSVPRSPAVAATPSCTGLDVGITLDGVELSGPLDSSGRDEIAYELQDRCGGVSQPGGLYHRHSLSDCLPHIKEDNALVGYALDGFGIFSPFDANGVELRTADLDECHGTTSPVMWDGEMVTMYHYVLTRDFPYTVSCFKGTPVSRSFPARPAPPMP